MAKAEVYGALSMNIMSKLLLCPLRESPHLFLLFSLSVFSFFSVTHADDTTSAAKAKLRVVATTGMIADVVRRIGGERIDVTSLMGEGVDPHLYKPTRSDISLLTNADIVFYNGLLLEGKMTDAFIRVAASGRKVVAVTESLDPEFLLEPPEFAGHYDPHVWMDPLAWSKAAEVIREQLSKSDAAGSAVYQNNFQELSRELSALHEYTEKIIRSVPSDRRLLITAHDAFNYFGRRYKLEVKGIQGLSTESEAGVQDVQRLVSLLVERKIPAVFVESTVSERNIRALLDGAAARGHHVVIGGKLFSDAMGKPGSYEGSYVGMIDHNATTIARALGGTAPVRGMQNRLAPQESAP